MNRKELYNTLSEDVKNKIKACKTEEEMMRVLGEEGIALDDDLLDSVSGGVGAEPDCKQNVPGGCERDCSNHCNKKCEGICNCN